MRTGEAAGFAVAGRQISEADLHGYIDGAPTTACRADLEAFLAAHPLIAERVEAYRSHIVAVNAALGAGEQSLPPPVAQLASRYARVVARSSVIRMALVILALAVVLCVVVESYGG